MNINFAFLVVLALLNVKGASAISDQSNSTGTENQELNTVKSEGLPSEDNQAINGTPKPNLAVDSNTDAGTTKETEEKEKESNPSVIQPAANSQNVSIINDKEETGIPEATKENENESSPAGSEPVTNSHDASTIKNKDEAGTAEATKENENESSPAGNVPVTNSHDVSTIKNKDEAVPPKPTVPTEKSSSTTTKTVAAPKAINSTVTQKVVVPTSLTTTKTVAAPIARNSTATQTEAKLPPVATVGSAGSKEVAATLAKTETKTTQITDVDSAGGELVPDTPLPPPPYEEVPDPVETVPGLGIDQPQARLDVYSKKALPQPEEEPSSNFPVLFMISILAIVGGYFLYHNKSKIMGLIVEGRGSTSRRPRYNRLKNVEEAMPGMRSKISA